MRSFRLGEGQSHLKVKKCCFATDEVVHLRHIINKKGIRPHGSKANALKDFPIHDVKSSRGFLGLLSFYRRIVPSLSPDGIS